jgi:hypothetical protein
MKINGHDRAKTASTRTYLFEIVNTSAGSNEVTTVVSWHGRKSNFQWRKHTYMGFLGVMKHHTPGDFSANP